LSSDDPVEIDSEESARVGEYKSEKGNCTGEDDNEVGGYYKDEREENEEESDDGVVELPCTPRLVPKPRPDNPVRKSDTLRLNAPDVSISDYFVQEQQTLRYQKKNRVYANTHMHTCTRTRTGTRLRMHIHKRTHKDIHTHTLTHTRMHIDRM
jgi:hypothetical protein